MTTEAEYYQAHKDDEDEWGDPLPARPVEKRRLAAMISVRFAPEEQERVRAAAEDAGQSVSNFVRQLVLRECGSRRSRASNITFAMAANLMIGELWARSANDTVEPQLTGVTGSSSTRSGSA